MVEDKDAIYKELDELIVQAITEASVLNRLFEDDKRIEKEKVETQIQYQALPDCYVKLKRLSDLEIQKYLVWKSSMKQFIKYKPIVKHRSLHKNLKPGSNKLGQVTCCDEVSFRCKVCATAFTSLTLLKKHLKKHITNDDVCITCNAKYTGKLKVHILRRHTYAKTLKHKLWFCKLCKGCFAFKDDVTKHECVHQNDSVIPYCGICGKQFNHKQSVQEHIIAVHLKLQPYMCITCGKLFSSNSNLTRHVLIHDESYRTQEKSYTCKLCNKKYLSFAALRLHLKKKHFTQNKCDLCNKTFSDYESLELHSLQKPALCISSTPESDNRNDKCKSTVCSICKKEFASDFSLQRHINALHLKTFPYVCTTCGKVFSQKQHLDRHVKGQVNCVCSSSA